MAELAKKSAEDKKGRNITILDISEISSIADFFVICTGGSSTNVQAIAGAIEEKVKNTMGLNARIEGYREGSWVLLDYGDVVIHVFQEEERGFYNLERLWADAPAVGSEINLA